MDLKNATRRRTGFQNLSKETSLRRCGVSRIITSNLFIHLIYDYTIKFARRFNGCYDDDDVGKELLKNRRRIPALIKSWIYLFRGRSLIH